MSTRTKVLGALWVPLLSGCMMPFGAWHGAGYAGMGHMQSRGAWDVTGVPPVAEASDGGLTIGLSIATVGRGGEALIEAALSENGVRREPTRGEVWLTIRKPGGSVDRLRMASLGASQGATHRVRYRFGDAGLYQIIAEGRIGSGADTRSVSVTTETKVDGQIHGHGKGLLMPAAVLGGLGMVGMMVLMMSGSAP